MEFRRFGSNITGSYWGCCAICIIQNFKVDPDSPASIQMVHGDSGASIGGKYAGKTYREMFSTLIRTGTFNTNDMPNHIFLASLTQSQLRGDIGRKWLAILKENGFEFIRASDNSVSSGPNLNDGDRTGSHNPVYLFGLFRNIGSRAIANPFLPPKEWTDLASVIPEATMALNKFEESCVELANEQAIAHRKLWDASSTKFYTRDELEKEGVPVILSGGMGKKPERADTKTETLLEPIAEVEDDYNADEFETDDIEYD
jgi:hypothetical protein